MYPKGSFLEFFKKNYWKCHVTRFPWKTKQKCDFGKICWFRRYPDKCVTMATKCQTVFLFLLGIPKKSILGIFCISFTFSTLFLSK